MIVSIMMRRHTSSVAERRKREYRGGDITMYRFTRWKMGSKGDQDSSYTQKKRETERMGKTDGKDLERTWSTLCEAFYGDLELG